MMDYGDNEITFHYCVLIKRFFNEDFIILLHYIDDMLFIGHDTRKIQSLKRELSESFTMKDFGPTN